jgi:hypothetical protein
MNNTQIATTEVVKDGQLVAITAVPKSYDFVAEKLNLGVLPKGTKEKPFTRKMLNALAISKGSTELMVKATLKEFDGIRRAHYAQSAVFLAAVSADPRFRKSMRTSTNKKTGEVIGWSATIRKEKSASISASTKIAQLEALVAQLTAKLTPALPVA